MAWDLVPPYVSAVSGNGASKAVQYLCARTLKKSRIGHAQSRAKKHTLALLRNGPLTAPLRTLPPKMPLYVHILVQLL